ncbi:MAG: DUF5987 family protein [Solirubrobacteraceae bacterium]
MSNASHGDLVALLTRRQVLARASTVAFGALALPSLPLPSSPAVSPTDATLQAFADTILPGCRAARTDLGNPIDPLAIAGVDPLPGAVQADALAFYHHPEVGFDALAPAFLSALEAYSVPHGGDFLRLPFDARVAVCLAGLDFSNPARLLWELTAAIPFIAFCAAPLIRNATAKQASGYRVMGLPGPAAGGYSDYSYERALSTELTRTGSLS